MPLGGRFARYQFLLPMIILQILSLLLPVKLQQHPLPHAVIHNSPASGRTLYHYNCNTTVLTTGSHAMHLTFHAFALSPDALKAFQYHYINKRYLETIFVNKYRIQ